MKIFLQLRFNHFPGRFRTPFILIVESLRFSFAVNYTLYIHRDSCFAYLDKSMSLDVLYTAWFDVPKISCHSFNVRRVVIFVKGACAEAAWLPSRYTDVDSVTTLFISARGIVRLSCPTRKYLSFVHNTEIFQYIKTNKVVQESKYSVHMTFIGVSLP